MDSYLEERKNLTDCFFLKMYEHNSESPGAFLMCETFISLSSKQNIDINVYEWHGKELALTAEGPKRALAVIFGLCK